MVIVPFAALIWTTWPVRFLVIRQVNVCECAGSAAGDKVIEVGRLTASAVGAVPSSMVALSSSAAINEIRRRG